MNIINTVQNGFSARLFAGITIVSLLLSAFPVAFFVANAANTDAVGDITLEVSPTSNPGEQATVSFLGTGTLDLTGWSLWDIQSSERNVFTFGTVALTDGQTFTVCNDVSCNGQISGGSTVFNDAGDTTELRDENGDVVVAVTWTGAGGGDTFSNTESVDYAPVVPAGPVENTDTAETFATVQEAIDDADTDNGDTIVMSADETTTAQITINKEITLDGGGFTIDAAFTKTDNSNNAAIGIIGTDNVTVTNIVLDGTNGTDLHGLNIYESAGITVETVESKNFRSGMVVNGSTVDTSDFSTEGNVWHGINVAPGSGVTDPSVLNISNTSMHGEVAPVPHIFTDNINAGPTITVNDVDDQYDFFDFPEVVEVAVTAETPSDIQAVQVPTARAYFLKTEVEPILGCTDETASNYDSAATEDNGSCEYPPVSYCIDPTQNMLTNGSFEEPEVTDSKKWQKMSSVPGWTVTKVSDNTPTTLELMENIFGNEAADGDQYAELDGDHSTAVSQIVPTQNRAAYQLSWAFAGRHDIDPVQNQLDVLVNGASYATEGPLTNAKGITVNDWTRTLITFTADSDMTEIAFADLGPSNSYGTYLDDVQLCLVAEPEPIVNVYATKIVCTDEADMPNWGAGGANITETTAADWMAANEGSSCQIVEDWEFEWADKSAKNPGNSYVGYGGSDWTTFNGSAQVPLSAVSSKSFWVREVLQEGYLPFAGGKNNDVSAEMYCHTDVLNYDNLDRVDGPVADGDYYCVAWNVLEEQPPQQCTILSGTETLVLETNQFAVEANESNIWTDEIDDATWVWVTERPENPEEYETFSFIETFTVSDVDEALLDIAVDDFYQVFVNGVLVPELDRTGPFSNFRAPAVKFDVDISSYLVDGENTLLVKATNEGQEGFSSIQNPAGVLYRLDIASEVACEVTTEPVGPATLVITNPAEPDLTLAGEFEFTADYNDNDPEVDFIRWAIRAGTCEASTNTVAGNVDGFSDNATFTGNNFSAIVDMSTWDNGDYCFVVNPDEGDDVPGEADLRATQTFILDNSVDSAPTDYFFGYKYSDENANGELDENDAGISGWEITATEGEGAYEPVVVLTDEFGFYEFNLPAGEWSITEENREGWDQTAVYRNGESVIVGQVGGQCFFDTTESEFSDVLSLQDSEEYYVDGKYECVFLNQEDEEVDPTPTTTSGGSSGTRTRLSSAAPAPLVLGASTDTCPFLTEYMQMGVDNDSMEVMKLQLFLNIFKDVYGGTENPVTGNFGIITDANVKAFQTHFRSEVLEPWYNQGIVGHTKPTGFVYKTTVWKINDLICGDVFPSLEGENLQSNIDLNARAVQD